MGSPGSPSTARRVTWKKDSLATRGIPMANIPNTSRPPLSPSAPGTRCSWRPWPTPALQDCRFPLKLIPGPRGQYRSGWVHPMVPEQVELRQNPTRWTEKRYQGRPYDVRCDGVERRLEEKVAQADSRSAPLVPMNLRLRRMARGMTCKRITRQMRQAL